MSDGDRLEPARTCVLLFDTLNGHLKTREGGVREPFRAPVANMVRLLAVARKSGCLVAYAVASHRADSRTSAVLVTDTDMRLGRWGPDGPHARPPVTAGSWEGAVIDELAPVPDDYIVPKYRWSAFFSTYLDLALRTRGVRTIVLVGGSTDVGIASTAFDARDLDYHTVVVRDACTYHEADNHKQFMRRIFPRMARVRATDAVIAMLGR